MIEENEKLKTMEEDEWFLTKKDKRKSMTIKSKHVSSFEIYVPDKKYYKRAGATQRSCIPKINEDIISFGIYSASTDEESMRISLINIFKEKLINDVNSINYLLKQLKKDNIISEDFKEFALNDIKINI